MGESLFKMDLCGLLSIPFTRTRDKSGLEILDHWHEQPSMGVCLAGSQVGAKLWLVGCCHDHVVSGPDDGAHSWDSGQG